MRLLLPLGLLALIGSIVIIVIYIIKNKYTEQTTASTYLWTLSEKFLKKRLPINRFVGLLSLILQILAVVCFSIAIAHPEFILKNAAHDYCIVLDASGSMNIENDGETRMEQAKSEISSLIKSSANGSAFTLVLVGDYTQQIFTGLTDKDRARLLLDEIEATASANGYSDALLIAQEFFNDNPSILTYLVTDKDVEQSENVNVIKVGEEVENYAVSGITKTHINGKLRINGNAVSYLNSAEVTISLTLDGGNEIVARENLSLTAGEQSEFSFEYEVDSYESFTVTLENEDAFALDNTVTVYNTENKESTDRALLVNGLVDGEQDDGLFVQAVLRAANVEYDVIPQASYKGETDYQLYIFNSYNPTELPKNASVWFINPSANVEKSGFSWQDTPSIELDLTLSYPEKETRSNTVEKLLSNVPTDGNNLVYIAGEYQKLKTYRKFNILATCDKNPAIFAGENDYGNREIVFAFDLHNTDWALNYGYSVLCSNLLNYVFPTALEQTNYYSGDVMQINVIQGCTSINVVAPSGKKQYLDTSNTSTEFELSEAGTYTVNMNLASGEKTYYVFVSVPEEESNPVSAVNSFSLQGEQENGARDGIYNDLLVYFILLALLFAADWMVYCYEQYQLR